MSKLRTCTAMVLTDGTTSYYHVFRGPVSRNGRVFYSHKADSVAVYKVVRPAEPDYRAIHATADAPPVFWQA